MTQGVPTQQEDDSAGTQKGTGRRPALDDGDFCEDPVFPEKLSIAEGQGSHPMQSLAWHRVAPSEW